MAISYVSSAAIESNSLALSTHLAGDLIILAAYTRAGVTAPTVPAGWFVHSGLTGVHTHCLIVAAKLAATASEVSGTWTDAEFLACAVYRSTTANAMVASSGTRHTIANPASIIRYPSIAVPNGYTDNWWVGIGAYRTNDRNAGGAPTGMTNRVNIAGTTFGEVSLHDTNANSATWSEQDVTLSGGTASASMAWVFGICETGISLAGGPSRPSNPFTQQVIG